LRDSFKALNSSRLAYKEFENCPAPGTKREIAAMRSPVFGFSPVQKIEENLSIVLCLDFLTFCVMKKHTRYALLIWCCLFASTLSWSQESETYFESNVGFSINDETGGFPGLSFLWGKRTFQSENRFTDRQFGLAAPSLVTLKIGQGWRNPETYRTFSYGVRVWPLHGYVQFGFLNPRCENRVSERTLRRLQRRGKSRENLLCGEWNISIEVGSALIDEYVDTDFFYDAALASYGIVTFSHRWYLD
jgi:hypothetical protein